MMRSWRNSIKAVLLVSIISLLSLSACDRGGLPIGATASATPTAVPPTPTPIPLKTLVICIGKEPETLYLYGDSSRAKWSVLEAIYDGPVDTVNYESSPVILEELPTLGQRGITLQIAPVTAGDAVANIEGDIVTLEKGVRVFAEGCTSPDCAVTWDGVSPLNLTQMVVRFHLLENITWSDGIPLTAEDSVFSYTVSADPATDVTKTNLERTFSYTALDESTVQWIGQPGYLTLNPADFFWIPLPAHQLSGLTAEQMNTDEMTTKTPLGWGAYKVDEWVSGDHIRLVKNLDYYRAAEGLPYFDELVYRFLPSTPEADLSAVVTGECDIIDTTVGLDSQIVSIRELETRGEIKSYFGMGPEWEGLNFGIQPASYDDVYNPYEDRQDYFGDVRVRQAVAYCVDREYIQTNITLSQSDIPVTYLPPDHPYAVTTTKTYEHNPSLGNQLLDEAGWLDTDGNPSTPRVAADVENVFPDTELTLNYYVTESELHASTSKAVVDSLAECGIKVNVTYLPVDEMYASGPDGLIFGRNFDLAELAWSTGRQSPCFLYISSEIPTAENKWLGTRYGGVNFSGFSNEEYDTACESVLSAGLNRELVTSQNERTQEILMEDLPVLPLFFHIKAMVSRPDLCGVKLDVSSRSALKDIESYMLAEVCLGD